MNKEQLYAQIQSKIITSPKLCPTYRNKTEIKCKTFKAFFLVFYCKNWKNFLIK